MTNYNEILDEILDWQTRLLVREAVTQNVADTKKLHITNEMLAQAKSEAKVDLTSLIKELVAEAKPPYKTDTRGATQNPDNAFYHTKKAQGYNEAIDQFEQNLLEALEEV